MNDSEVAITMAYMLGTVAALKVVHGFESPVNSKEYGGVVDNVFTQ